jgi:hypothetical protein
MRGGTQGFLKERMSSIPGSIVVGLEQGVLALLGSKSSRALVSLTPHADLVLLSCALYCILQAVPEWMPVAGRVSSIMANVFYTIGLNTLFDSVVMPGDTGLTCINLLGIFVMGSALDPNNSMTVTSQYLLVSTLSNALRGFREEGVLIACVLAFLPRALSSGELFAGLAQLVAVDTFSTWLRGGLPRETLLLSTLVFLYLFAPFITEFPPLGRLYRFAVFAISNDSQLHSLSPWMLAVSMWILWQLEPDPVSKSLAAVAGANLGVLVLMDAMQFAMDNDPALILVSLLLIVRVLE